MIIACYCNSVGLSAHICSLSLSIKKLVISVCKHFSCYHDAGREICGREICGSLRTHLLILLSITLWRPESQVHRCLRLLSFVITSVQLG